MVIDPLQPLRTLYDEYQPQPQPQPLATLNQQNGGASGAMTKKMHRRHDPRETASHDCDVIDRDVGKV